MECKGFLSALIAIFNAIGIYPEWNVKIFVSPKCFMVEEIGIYPEWNVK